MPTATQAAPASQTGTLVRLQLKLFWRYATSSTGMMIGNIVMALMLLGSLIPAMFGLGAMRGMSAETRGVALTLIFAVLTFLWPVAVTLMTGNNDMLDAGRFALFPVKVGRLLPGLVISAGMGLGGVMMLLLGIGYVVAWSTSPGTLIAAIVGWVVGFATCLASSRALSAVLADVLRRRKARDLLVLVIFIGIMALSIGMQVVSQMMTRSVESTTVTSFTDIVGGFGTVARVLAWTPFGWAWGLPWALAQGNALVAVVWLVLALVWLGGMAWIWGAQFAKRLVSPLDATGGAEKIVKANPLDRFLPDTPAGAVAKRGLRYFRRDPRRLMGMIATLIMPVMMAVIVGISGPQAAPGDQRILGQVMMFVPAMVGWMVGLFVATDICYDGSALAQQIVAGVSGRDDRWGRAMASLIVFGGLQIVIIIGFSIYARQWAMLPAVIGLSAALLVGGVGIGSWIGSIWYYPQPPAGSSLVGRNGAGGAAGFLASMVGMFLPVVTAIPVIIFVALTFALGALWAWVALVVGCATGALLLWWGVRAGGHRLDRTWPEVLAKITWKG